MGYLLDTSICVFFLRGKLNLDKVIKKVGLENCYISEITVAELRFGAKNSDDSLKSNKAVDIFLKGLTYHPNFWIYKKICCRESKTTKNWKANAR